MTSRIAGSANNCSQHVTRHNGHFLRARNISRPPMLVRRVAALLSGCILISL
jgi:hypothetical protein